MVCGFCYVSEDTDTLFMSEFFVMKKISKTGNRKEGSNRSITNAPWQVGTDGSSQQSYLTPTTAYLFCVEN